MARNRKASSSGSLIAARNLTMDSAPTSPSDSATDERTMLMISAVVTVSTMKFRAKSLRFESDCPK